MNWVTEKEVEAAAKTRKGAIAISRKVWRQRYEATKKELKVLDVSPLNDRFLRYQTIGSNLCGLCLFYGGLPNSCLVKKDSGFMRCPLSTKSNKACCEEYDDVKVVVDCLKFDYQSYHKASGRMYRRLLKIK